MKGKIVIAKKPENWYALTEEKTYKVGGVRHLEGDTYREEWLIKDDLNWAWYPSSAFYTIEEFREIQLGKLGI